MCALRHLYVSVDECPFVSRGIARFAWPKATRNSWRILGTLAVEGQEDANAADVFKQVPLSFEQGNTSSGVFWDLQSSCSFLFDPLCSHLPCAWHVSSVVSSFWFHIFSVGGQSWGSCNHTLENLGLKRKRGANAKLLFSPYTFDAFFYFLYWFTCITTGLFWTCFGW